MMPPSDCQGDQRAMGFGLVAVAGKEMFRPARALDSGIMDFSTKGELGPCMIDLESTDELGPCMPDFGLKEGVSQRTVIV